MARKKAKVVHPLAWPLRIGFIVLFLVFWELSVRLGWIDKLFLAGPIDSTLYIPKALEMAGPHLRATLTSFFMAFFAGAASGLILGLLVGSFRYTYRAFQPILVLGVTIPKVTLLPLFILWFGIGKATIVIYALLSGFFPMVINSMAAVMEVKPNQIIAARALGFTGFQIYRKVVFPSMLPVLSTGLFFACHSAMTGVFIMEMALARFGLGALIYSLAVTFRTPELYAAIALTASITVIINIALWYMARHFSKWRG